MDPNQPAYQANPAPGSFQPEAPENAQPPAKTGKYKVFEAISDVITALKTNGLSVGITALLLIFASVVVAVVVSLLWIFALVGLAINNASLPVSISMVVLLVLFAVLLNVAVNTIFMNALSLAFYGGAHGQKTSPSNDIKTGARYFIRVALANMLFGLLVAGPMLAIATVGLFVAFASGNDAGGFMPVFFLAFAAALAWVIIALLRFALIPMAALFEPGLPILKTPARSSHLLRNGGQWFLFKAVLLFYAVIIVLSLISGSMSNLSAESGISNVVANLIFVLFIPLVLGVPVMLYINRKAVKG